MWIGRPKFTHPLNKTIQCGCMRHLNADILQKWQHRCALHVKSRRHLLLVCVLLCHSNSPRRMTCLNEVLSISVATCDSLINRVGLLRNAFYLKIRRSGPGAGKPSRLFGKCRWANGWGAIHKHTNRACMWVRSGNKHRQLEWQSVSSKVDVSW